jgi:heterodisulfide reductase subunit A-like polyferredoxin
LLLLFLSRQQADNTLNPHGYRICCRVAAVAAFTIKGKNAHTHIKKEYIRK